MRVIEPVETAAPRNVFQSPFQLGGHAWSMEVWRGRKVIGVIEMTELGMICKRLSVKKPSGRRIKEKRRKNIGAGSTILIVDWTGSGGYI